MTIEHNVIYVLIEREQEYVDIALQRIGLGARLAQAHGPVTV